MEKDISSVKEDFLFQKREWVAKRFFWCLMALFLIVGLSGLLGSGPLSTTVVEYENFTIQYERFLRVKMGSEIIVKASLDDSLVISFNSDYFQKVEATNIIPAPTSTTLNKNTVVFTFPGKSFGNVIFYLTPINRGSQNLELVVNGKKEVCEQFIYF